MVAGESRNLSASISPQKSPVVCFDPSDASLVTNFACKRNCLRPALFVERQAASARSRKFLSEGVGELPARGSSSQPTGLARAATRHARNPTGVDHARACGLARGHGLGGVGRRRRPAGHAVRRLQRRARQEVADRGSPYPGAACGIQGQPVRRRPGVQPGQAVPPRPVYLRVLRAAIWRTQPPMRAHRARVAGRKLGLDESCHGLRSV